MKKVLLIFCLWNCTILMYAQTGVWERVSSQDMTAAYQKAGNWFVATQSYSFKLKYTSFKDHISNMQVESSGGYYKRQANKYITEALGIKTIQNSEIKLIVDSADKIITIMDPGNLNPAMASKEELEDMLSNTKYLKRIKQIKSTRYRIEFNKNEQLEAFEFVINEKGILEGLIYYYSEQIEKIDGQEFNSKPTEQKMKPRLEINFYGHETPAKFSEAELDLRTFIINEKGKINLTHKYKNYRVLDYRLQAKN